MKKHRKLLLVLCILTVSFCLVFLFLNYQNRKSQMILNLTAEQKISDFNALCDILDENYPFWHEVDQTGINKEQIYDAYRNDIMNTTTDIEFFKCIDSFLHEFQGYGHLSVLDGYMYGLYVDTISESADLLSRQDEQMIKPLRDVLENPVSRNTYNLLDQSHEGFRSIIGLKDEYKSPRANNNTQTPEIETAIYDEQTAYVKIDSFELKNYQKDQATLEAFLAQIRDTPNLIIDLRKNSGGSDLYWQDLIVKPNAKEYLSAERYFLFNQSELIDNYVSALKIEPKAINTLPEPLLTQYQNSFSCYTIDTESVEKAANPYSGKLWLLVDESVYSASENFVMFCKNTGFATVVGTSTGGDGGIADPILAALPNSGLIIRFSAFYGLNEDGSGNESVGTTPDIVTAQNEDALSRCRELINKAN